MDKEFDAVWIRHCMMEYVGVRLEGMDDYFRKCWKESGTRKGYDRWFEETRISGTVCEMIGEWWCESFKGKGDQFKEFMKKIDFSGYVDQFIEDFEVEIVWVQEEGHKDRLDINVKML
jgi:hypothetical protein